MTVTTMLSLVAASAPGRRAFRRPAGHHRGHRLAGVGGVGHAGGDGAVEVDVHLVAGRDLVEVAHLRPGGDDEARAVGVVAQPHLAGRLVDRLDRRAGAGQRLLRAALPGPDAHLRAGHEHERGHQADHVWRSHSDIPRISTARHAAGAS